MVGSVLLPATPANAQNNKTVIPTPGVHACIANAAAFHKVNTDVLQAILRVESSFKSTAVNRNDNGTLDVGIGQINTIHFKELAKHSIGPSDLLDPCIGTYVAAWHLAKQIQKYGNTWFGIAAYHSATPYFNSRYQILLRNALVDMEVLAGPKQSVPPLRSSISPSTRSNARTSERESIFALNQ